MIESTLCQADIYMNIESDLEAFFRLWRTNPLVMNNIMFHRVAGALIERQWHIALYHVANTWRAIHSTRQTIPEERRFWLPTTGLGT
jgi:hypothetical protein